VIDRVSSGSESHGCDWFGTPGVQARLMPGLTTLTWTSMNIDLYLTQVCSSSTRDLWVARSDD
jgi:hypothetical protein